MSQNFTDKIGYDEFRRNALDSSLSEYEKIGFPDSYRQNQEGEILSDFRQKLPKLDHEGAVIIDIGCGASALTRALIEQAEKFKQQLLLLDSQEMLSLLPQSTAVEQIPGSFPGTFTSLEGFVGKVDAIICYSVIQYVFREGSIYSFIDHALKLLRSGGRLLIGDIPNFTKRKRFLTSEIGARFHQSFHQSKELPIVEFSNLDVDEIDDSVVIGILSRYRGFGFETYLLPQRPSLTMANRREDIVIEKR